MDAMSTSTDPQRILLRHIVATLAYRGGKAVRSAPPSFATFRAAEDSRSPLQILAHIGDLLDWALTMARGEARWVNGPSRPWDEEVKRFFASLTSFDAFLEGETPLASSVEKMFQGPMADALTHVGQLTMLRRLAGCPVKGENYFVADIVVGRVGAEQAAPRREFD
jgi:hypothetical protein